MRLIKLECPDCGANLEIPEGHHQFFCQYCCRKILIDEEINKAEIVHIYRDEAKLKELELQEEARIRHETSIRQEWNEYKSNKKRAITTFLIIYLIVFIGCWILYLVTRNNIGIAIGIASAFILPAFYPHKYVERSVILTYIIYWVPMYIFFFYLFIH